MTKSAVAVLGAGNLRVGPHLLAALASSPTDYRLDIRLWDASVEWLDLFDRFLRTCLEITDYGHYVRSFRSLEEAVEGDCAIILALHEDGSRRFLQPVSESSVEPEPPVEDERSLSIVEFGLGDPNRPTPRANLSHETRSVIYRPAVSGTREDVIHQTQERLRPLLEGRDSILDLTRDVASPEWLQSEHLDWPPPMTPAEATARPHQVLRWTQGDPTLAEFIEASRESPIAEWLRRGE